MMNVSTFMGRLNFQDLVDRQWLVCPSCREFLTLSLENSQNFRCPACAHEYLGRNGIASLLPQSEDSVKKDIQVFWGELYGAIYAEEDTKRAAEELNAQMPSLGELFFKANSKDLGHIFQEETSESINTGTACSYVIGLADAQKVKEEQTTSSPGFRSRL